MREEAYEKKYPVKAKTNYYFSVYFNCYVCGVCNLYYLLNNGLVQATIITPAISVDESMPAITSEPSVAVTEALWQFRGTTVLVMFCLIAIGSALTYLFASRTLKPLEDLTERVQHIDIHNLDEGVSIPQTKDEVAKLAQAFQNMTEKLNLSYQVQKNFSANAAHELRTPSRCDSNPVGCISNEARSKS